jgi:hypothetical protein
MKISLNSLLTEAVIDNLNISKMDKAILKSFHILRSEKNYLPSGKEFNLTVADKIMKVEEMLNTGDYQRLYSASKFYEKYGNFLFNDIPDLIEDIDINFVEDREVIEGILYEFFYKNYRNKEIYNYRGNSWVLDTMFTPFEASLEESFGVFIQNHNDVYPPCVIYFDLLPNKSTNKIGADFVIQDDEFAEFNGANYKDGVYDEMIDSEWIDFNYPKDLKEKTLRKYFELLLNTVVNKVIKPNDYKFDEFLEFMNQQ